MNTPTNLIIIAIVILILVTGVFIASSPSPYTPDLPIIGLTKKTTVSPLCIGISIEEEHINSVLPAGKYELTILNRNLAYSVTTSTNTKNNITYCLGILTTMGE